MNGIVQHVTEALSSFGTKILDECGISFNNITKKMTFIADIFLPGVQYTEYYSLLMSYLTMTFVMSRVPQCPYPNETRQDKTR